MNRRKLPVDPITKIEGLLKSISEEDSDKKNIKELRSEIKNLDIQVLSMLDASKKDSLINIAKFAPKKRKFEVIEAVLKNRHLSLKDQLNILKDAENNLSPEQKVAAAKIILEQQQIKINYYSHEMLQLELLEKMNFLYIKVNEAIKDESNIDKEALKAIKKEVIDLEKKFAESLESHDRIFTTFGYLLSSTGLRAYVTDAGDITNMASLKSWLQTLQKAGENIHAIKERHRISETYKIDEDYVKGAKKELQTKNNKILTELNSTTKENAEEHYQLVYKQLEKMSVYPSFHHYTLAAIRTPTKSSLDLKQPQVTTEEKPKEATPSDQPSSPDQVKTNTQAIEEKPSDDREKLKTKKGSWTEPQTDERSVLKRHAASEKIGLAYEQFVMNPEDPRKIQPAQHRDYERSISTKASARSDDTQEKEKISGTEKFEKILKKMLANDPDVELVVIKPDDRNELQNLEIKYKGKSYDLIELMSKADLTQLNFSQKDLDNYMKFIFPDLKQGEEPKHGLLPSKPGESYGTSGPAEELEEIYRESLADFEKLHPESKLGQAHFAELCALNLYTQEFPCNGMNCLTRLNIAGLNSTMLKTKRGHVTNPEYYKGLLFAAIIGKNAANKYAHEVEGSQRFEAQTAELLEKKTSGVFTEQATGISTGEGGSSFVTSRLENPQSFVKNLKDTGRLAKDAKAKPTLTVFSKVRGVYLEPISSSRGERELLVVGDSQNVLGREIGDVQTVIRREAKKSIPARRKTESTLATTASVSAAKEMPPELQHALNSHFKGNALVQLQAFEIAFASDTTQQYLAEQAHSATHQQVQQRYRELTSQLAIELRNVSHYLFASIDDKDMGSTKEGYFAPESFKKLPMQINKITTVVESEIINAPNTTARVLIMERWLGIMQRSAELGDFPTVMGISSAMLTTSIERLEISKCLSPQGKKIFDGLFMEGPIYASNKNADKLIAHRKDAIVPNLGIYKTMIIGNKQNIENLENKEINEFISLIRELINALSPQEEKLNEQLQKILDVRTKLDSDIGSTDNEIKNIVASISGEIPIETQRKLKELEDKKRNLIESHEKTKTNLQTLWDENIVKLNSINAEKHAVLTTKLEALKIRTAQLKQFYQQDTQQIIQTLQARKNALGPIPDSHSFTPLQQDVATGISQEAFATVADQHFKQSKAIKPSNTKAESTDILKNTAINAIMLDAQESAPLKYTPIVLRLHNERIGLINKLKEHHSPDSTLDPEIKKFLQDTTSRLDSRINVRDALTFLETRFSAYKKIMEEEKKQLPDKTISNLFHDLIASYQKLNKAYVEMSLQNTQLHKPKATASQDLAMQFSTEHTGEMVASKKSAEKEPMTEEKVLQVIGQFHDSYQAALKATEHLKQMRNEIPSDIHPTVQRLANLKKELNHANTYEEIKRIENEIIGIVNTHGQALHQMRESLNRFQSAFEAFEQSSGAMKDCINDINEIINADIDAKLEKISLTDNKNRPFLNEIANAIKLKPSETLKKLNELKGQNASLFKQVKGIDLFLLRLNEIKNYQISAYYTQQMSSLYFPNLGEEIKEPTKSLTFAHEIVRAMHSLANLEHNINITTTLTKQRIERAQARLKNAESDLQLPLASINQESVTNKSSSLAEAIAKPETNANKAQEHYAELTGLIKEIETFIRNRDAMLSQANNHIRDLSADSDYDLNYDLEKNTSQPDKKAKESILARLDQRKVALEDSKKQDVALLALKTTLEEARDKAKQAIEQKMKAQLPEFEKINTTLDTMSAQAKDIQEKSNEIKFTESDDINTVKDKLNRLRQLENQLNDQKKKLAKFKQENKSDLEKATAHATWLAKDDISSDLRKLTQNMADTDEALNAATNKMGEHYFKLMRSVESQIAAVHTGSIKDENKLQSLLQLRNELNERISADLFAWSQTLFSTLTTDEINGNTNPDSPGLQRAKSAATKLTAYIKQDILDHKSIHARTLAMERWINLMHLSYEKGDYHTLCCIDDALRTEPVIKLDTTLAGLSPKAKLFLANMDVTREKINKRELTKKSFIPYLPALQATTTPYQQEINHNKAIIKFATDLKQQVDPINQHIKSLLDNKTTDISQVKMTLSTQLDLVLSTLATLQIKYEKLTEEKEIIALIKNVTTLKENIAAYQADNEEIKQKLIAALLAMQTLSSLADKIIAQRQQGLTPIEETFTTIMKETHQAHKTQKNISPVSSIESAIITADEVNPHVLGMNIPSGKFTAPSTIIQAISPTVIATHGTIEDEANKQLQYRNAILNPVLADMLKDKIIKSTAPHVKPLWVNTLDQIKKINAVLLTETEPNKEEMAQLLHNIGFEASETQLTKIQSENIRLRHALADMGLHDESEKRNWLEFNRQAIHVSQKSLARQRPIETVTDVLAKKQRRESQLQQVVTEFYTTEKTFHDNMKKLVDFFYDKDGQLKPDDQLLRKNREGKHVPLSTAERQLLDKFLKPYKRLITNPFSDQPADSKQAVEKILAVMETRFEFSTMLGSIAQISTNSSQFSEFRQLINAVGGFDLVDKTTKDIDASVEAFAIQPVQRIPRQLLLLRDIAKNIDPNETALIDKIQLTANQLDNKVLHINASVAHTPPQDKRQEAPTLYSLNEEIKKLITKIQQYGDEQPADTKGNENKQFALKIVDELRNNKLAAVDKLQYIKTLLANKEPEPPKTLRPQLEEFKTVLEHLLVEKKRYQEKEHFVLNESRGHPTFKPFAIPRKTATSTVVETISAKTETDMKPADNSAAEKKPAKDIPSTKKLAEPTPTNQENLQALLLTLSQMTEMLTSLQKQMTQLNNTLDVAAQRSAEMRIHTIPPSEAVHGSSIFAHHVPHAKTLPAREKGDTEGEGRKDTFHK